MLNKYLLVSVISAVILSGCSHLKVKPYEGAKFAPTQAIEVFHAQPSRPYVEIAEISDEGVGEPAGEIIAQGKTLGADGVYFLPPEDTGRLAIYSHLGRSIYRYRAIAFKWK